MSTVLAALQDPRSEVTQVSLPSPWPMGRLAPFACVNACGKRRALKGEKKVEAQIHQSLALGYSTMGYWNQKWISLIDLWPFPSHDYVASILMALAFSPSSSPPCWGLGIA